MNPIRVAQVIGVACNGGVESVIMNYYRHVDKSKVQFDFLVESESQIINKEEIEKMGGKVIIIPSYKNLRAYNKELKRIFKENKYDIVHSNMNTLSVFPLRMAKKCGIKNRIAHSHSTSNKKEWKRNILKSLLKPFSKVYATKYFACTEHAARYQFGDKAVKNNKVTILNNGIEIEKFKYDKDIGSQMRNELGLNDKFVVGHIGRFVQQKNHEFLIDAFYKVQEKIENSCLLLVGEGPLEEKIKEKAKMLKIEDKVYFSGCSNSPDKLYNAMDVFAFPSLYEGLGIVAIEAQCSGLPCLCSDNVPNDVDISEFCKFIPLEDSKWSDSIISSALNKDKFKRGNVKLKNDNFDIVKLASFLEKQYEEICS